MSILEEITSIFKREKGFERLFSLFIDKYRSYERMEKGISVVLQNPSTDEKRALSGFIGRDFSANKTIKVTAEKMEKSILNSPKFKKHLTEVSFLDILELYAGKKLVSNRQVADTYLYERNQYFDSFAKESLSTEFTTLLKWISHNENKNNRFYANHKQDPQKLKNQLQNINFALSLFPLTDYIYLPVFASEVTGDPHGFDINTEQGKLFIYTLQVLSHESEAAFQARGLNAEKTTELLYGFKILRDDLLNFATVFNLRGKNKNGQENLLLKGASDEKAQFHLPLKEIMKLNSVEAIGNKVFMVENSGVASHLVNELQQQGIHATVFSGNGQLKLATLRLLDLFVQNDGTIYYSGDFDPEGLLMTQRLKKRYQQNFNFWLFDVDSYKKTIPTEFLNEKRLKQLKGLTDSQLKILATNMEAVGKAGYQEKLLVPMLRSIRSLTS